VRRRISAETRELLHRDYAAQGIEPGTRDPRLVAIVAAFLRGAEKVPPRERRRAHGEPGAADHHRVDNPDPDDRRSRCEG
jgi:hypothetical protein